MKDLPKSAWQRSRAMASLALRMASKEVGGRLRSAVASSESESVKRLATRVEQAKLLAESLGRMKGALMKAGQLLSIDAGDLLPPEVAEVLGKLQGSAEPMDFPPMREVALEDLGADKLARLVGLGEHPPASASIGQVYRATVDGESVAVKVQYPGVADSIESDLALLQKLGQGMVSLSGRKVDLADFVTTLREVLQFEADYERERGYLERFGVALAGDHRFIVPKAYPDLSSRRVLTMSWEEGMPLGQWASTSQTREARHAVGRAVLDLYCLELFTLGMVQTDPNFGNFLIRDAGEEPRIVLLDFGATLEFDATFRNSYSALVRAMASGDAARVIDEGMKFELLDARESDATRELFTEMLIASFAPFSPDRQPFAFRDPEYMARMRELGERFARSVKFSPPPKQLVFLHRKLGGIFQLLKRLDVVIDLRPYAAAITDG